MQHLGSEDELKPVLREILLSMSPRERMENFTEDELKQLLPEILATMSPEVRLQGMSPQERLQGISEEEILKGLTAEQREHLRQLLQQPRPLNGDNSTPAAPGEK
jgi:hypothetical protein